jgi:hypothetical protein
LVVKERNAICSPELDTDLEVEVEEDGADLYALMNRTKGWSG